MPMVSQYRLHLVSVVVTAQSHNPSILTPEFLSSSGIVPDDWTVGEAIGVPPFSLVGFQNGVRWTLDAARLNVTEGCAASFQDAYLIHDSVIEYLRKVDYVPYRSLGLNWTVSAESGDPGGWLTRRFLKDGPWSKRNQRPVSMIPRFRLDTGGPVLNLAFGDQLVAQRDAESSDSISCISVDCNVHHEGPLNAVELRDAIGLWKSHQSLIVKTLDTLLGDEPK